MDKDTLFYKKQSIACRGRLLEITLPKVMGILNITPDSFFDGGTYTNEKEILTHVGKMIRDGVDIIDVGAYSSRPGAVDVSEQEEIERLKRALLPIRNQYPDVFISVDTFRAKVASVALSDFEVDIVNDISGGSIEPEIIDVVADAQVPYITMHMQGTPQNMQKNPTYEHVVKDVLDYFAYHLEKLRAKGINDIIIDPGFGFGKTIEHNYQLLSGLDVFQMLEVPVLVGVSRKSMIYNLLESSAKEALGGTIALNLIALQKGATFIRVHDVKEAKELITIYEKLVIESENSINLLGKAVSN